MTDDADTHARCAAFRRTWDVDADAVPAGFFSDLHDRFPDPWALEERWSEERKRALTMAALPRPRYRTALEVGSAAGLLTELLATRCERLLAIDVAAAAVRRTRDRVATQSCVTAVVMEPPDQWPKGCFDLIVLSEVLYFTAGARLERFIAGAVERLAPAGHLVAVHYRPATDIHLVDGDTVHALLSAMPGLRGVVHHVEGDMLLDVLERVGT